MFRGKKREEPVKEEVFDVDLEHGAVTRKIDGSRVMMMGSHGWASIEKELETTFITGAAVIMQRVGYSYGRAMGRAARNQGIVPEQTFEQMQALAKESGWGLFTLGSGDLYGGVARITVRDCYFCLHSRESTGGVCFVLAGLVGGISDEIVGATHRVTEEKCIAKGDAVCEILVERVG